MMERMMPKESKSLLMMRMLMNHCMGKLLVRVCLLVLTVKIMDADSRHGWVSPFLPVFWIPRRGTSSFRRPGLPRAVA
jgi:hypothetical protein